MVLSVPIFYLLWTAVGASSSYYMDCGASSETTDQGQVFTGDSSPPAGVELKFQGSSTSLTSSSSSNSNSSLSSTARSFTSDSSYHFETSPGTYLLRLHFFAFSDTLSSARFSVSSNAHTLLPNFTGSQASNSPLFKEFLLPVLDSTLRLYFTPIGPSASAFINAIEVISAALNLTDVDSPIIVTPSSGYNGSFSQFGSRVLEPLYRLNMGGSNVTASADTLRRSWWRDDSYLVAGRENTTAIGPFGVNFQHENSTSTDAPADVYGTARGWNTSFDSSSSGASTLIRNATWSFSASSDTPYLLRLHFCDIVSIAQGQIAFNLYVFTKFVWEVYPFNITAGNPNPAPFCLDFVVKSDGLGLINLTIGSIHGYGGAFLNGLEIMGFVNGSTAEPTIQSGRGTKVLLIACVAAAGFALLLLLSSSFLCFLRRKGKKTEAPVEDFDWPLAMLNASSESKSTITTTTVSDNNNTTSLSSLPSLHLRIPIGVIKQVTRNFDEALVIGQGGFGKVYKGVLRNGVKVAVKRSDSKHGQGLPEFQTEITVLSRIRHRHLVSLIGYCDDNGEMILVYEYMEKGTLREHLYGSDQESLEPLSWKQRLEICIGAARGLHYLHTGSSGGIIHRDVKSTNILLDEKLVAKVADFGLSRSGALEQETHVSTVVKGTFGYLDPEYYQLMQLTDKSDVYSFGVLLLEVLCARLVLDTSLPREEVNLADWAMTCHRNGDLERVIDPSLAGARNINPNSLAKFVETAKKCLNECGTDRPPMSDVLWDLEYTLQLHKFGVGAAFGDSTFNSTTQASFNLPMLDLAGFSSTAFGDSTLHLDQQQQDVDDGDSGLLPLSMPNHSVSPPSRTSPDPLQHNIYHNM